MSNGERPDHHGPPHAKWIAPDGGCIKCARDYADALADQLRAAAARERKAVEEALAQTETIARTVSPEKVPEAIRGLAADWRAR